MTKQSSIDWLPPVSSTAKGHRRVGVEIELAGVVPEAMSACISSLYGGHIRAITPIECVVENTAFGDFKLELDASYLKALVEKQGDIDPHGQSLTSAVVDMITWAAEQVVPWEVVTPPMEVTNLAELESLVSALRDLGALGTRHALHYAFGVHLNPELPNLQTQTILNYLRAYFCLYDWIVEQEQIDTTRRLTTHIKHFDEAYIASVIDPDYRPSQSELIEGYLRYNPTRNRSLDLLPLFALLDSAQVRSVVDDPRIKPRPTFHYRLPNCDIDNPNWNLNFPWRLWLEVEKLAGKPEKLEEMCNQYQQELTRLTHPLESRWARRVAEWIIEESG